MRGFGKDVLFFKEILHENAVQKNLQNINLGGVKYTYEINFLAKKIIRHFK